MKFLKLLLFWFGSLALFVSCGSTADVEASAPLDGSPFDAYFEAEGGSDATFTDFQIQVQESLALCMRTQGFEYTPFIPTDFESSNNGDLEEEEFVELFGYGISTDSTELFTLFAEDPNTDYLLSLPETDGKAYLIELYGEQIGSAIADEELIPDTTNIALEDQGCLGQSLNDNGGSELWDGISRIGAKIDSYETEISLEPAVIEATDNWAACMKGDGFSYSDRDEAEQDIEEQFSALITPHFEGISALTSDEATALLEEDDADVLPEFDLDGLNTLQELELSVAGSDHDCFVEHLADQYLQRRYAAERQILDDDQELFEELRQQTGQ